VLSEQLFIRKINLINLCAIIKQLTLLTGLTYEDVYDSITQEESDWSLRQQLKVSPEERYQHKKNTGIYTLRVGRVPKNGYDGHGSLPEV
jgi:hypothetical protein